MSDEKPPSSQPAEPLFALVLLTGPEKDRRILMGEGDEVFLGRSQEAQIVINDLKASRRHTRCYCEGGNLKVTDLGSFNGTFVNGNRTEQDVLFAGDSLQVASLRIRIEAANESQSSTTESSSAGRSSVTSGTTMGNVLSDVLTPDKLASMVKFLQERSKTGALVIHTSWGSGKIYLREGKVISATIVGATHISPQKAIQRLMRSQSGSLAFSAEPIPPSSEEVTDSLQDILAEDANFLEAYAELEKQLPSPTAGLAINEAAINADQDFTLDEEEIIHLVRQKGTVSHVMDHFSGTDSVAIQTLVSLVRSGFIKYIKYAR